MAGIIKAHASKLAGQAAHPAAFNFADMGDQADSYLKQVREQASQMIAQARSEAEQIKTKAQSDGRQAALKAAEAAIQSKLDEQLKQLMPALESAAQQLAQAKDQWQRHWESNLVHLATKIAERVVRREIASQADIPLALIQEALELATGSQKVTLHLNPTDRAALGDRVGQLAARMVKLGPVHVVGDETVGRGGCRVHTEFGVIDQQIESQLKRIETELQ
jgi:flagellar assembly protein FliH